MPYAWAEPCVPAAALAEAALVEGIEVLGADCLIDIVDWLRGDNAALRRAGDGDDLAAVSGEEAFGLGEPVLSE